MSQGCSQDSTPGILSTCLLCGPCGPVFGPILSKAVFSMHLRPYAIWMSEQRKASHLPATVSLSAQSLRAHLPFDVPKQIPMLRPKVPTAGPGPEAGGSPQPHLQGPRRSPPLSAWPRVPAQPSTRQGAYRSPSDSSCPQKESSQPLPSPQSPGGGETWASGA